MKGIATVSEKYYLFGFSKMSTIKMLLTIRAVIHYQNILKYDN